MTATDFIKDLNEEQQRAVKNFQGPSLIVAGAGSGKTRVLTYRIAYLLQQGVDPRSVLSLTFTNKAAGEMRERISALVGDASARSIWMGTFHSMFCRILRAEAQKIGFPATFTIYDTQDSRNLVKQIIKELQLDDELYKPAEVFGRISSAKNNLVTPSVYAQNTQVVQQDMAARKPMIGEIFRLYAMRCQKAGAMDFDDLLLHTNILFRDHPEVLSRYQEKFRYILVDEYQDTNYAQYLIVKKLSQQHRNVCVVGDDSQSIYAFRGAKIENILNFRKDYPDYKLYKLEQNYRSTRTIVNAANSVIEKNKNRIPKQVWSAGEEGPPIRLFESQTDIAEGFAIASSIVELKYSEHLSNDDFAILYRTNAQSRVLEESLRKMNIPYRIFGGLSFYQRKDVKDFLAYLRLIINPQDDEAFKRVINFPPRGIGATTMGHLAEAASAREASLWEAAINAAVWVPALNRGIQARLRAFAELMQQLAEQSSQLDAYELALRVLESSGIRDDLNADKSPEGVTRSENIEEVLNGVREYVVEAGKVSDDQEADDVSLAGYLQNVSLLTDADMQQKDDRDKVTLMTVHASKGLEFDVVYLAGMEENLFPSQMAIATATDIEEERRLFYVGLTRARKYAFLSCAESRFRWGSQVFCSPSRFIGEIDPLYLQVPGSLQKGSPDNGLPSGKSRFPAREHGPEGVQPVTPLSRKGLVALSRTRGPSPNSVDDFPADDPKNIREGMQVEHQRFGRGTVTGLEGEAPHVKATVQFRQSGTRQLLLKFARLRIVK